ncbi:MAG: NusG domain II-containing protein [Candidatus Limiplasma sp.]|nr:NusG domain II-containing protein [Candidatus Limiplasma sp.]MEA5144500.1 NusG domain II-containing protein [Candidatus Limiplasma sp.]
MKRRDWLILTVVLLASLALFLLRPLAAQPDAGASLRITVAGKLYQTVPLAQAQDIVIDQEDGSHNVVRVSANGFVMAQSNCHNQDCVLQGEVTLDNIGTRPLANQIICLPHRVVLELVTGDEQTLELP